MSNVIKEAFILRSLRSLSKVHWTFFTYHGPSLIICYAPCINHGIKIGMGRTQNEEKKAVECGYWHLWHFNPAEEDAGKNGFHLDSKEPDWSKLLTAFNYGIRCSQPQHRDLATPTLLHFGNAQASLALRSTSAASIMGEVRYCRRLRTPMKLKSNEVSNSLMKTFFTGLDSIQRCSVPLTGYPQEAEELFVATERNAKLRYEGYKKLSEM